MSLSPELIAIIITSGAFLAAMIGMFLICGAWFVRRMDEGFERLHASFDRLDTKFD